MIWRKGTRRKLQIVTTDEVNICFELRRSFFSTIRIMRINLLTLVERRLNFLIKFSSHAKKSAQVIKTNINGGMWKKIFVSYLFVDSNEF
jgi:hypothetical protein